jgi:hypothetical protein
MRPDKVPERKLYVARGAPDEIQFIEKDATSGEYSNFAGPVTLRIVLQDGTIINLSEGSGITVNDEETVGIARGTITVQLTVAQSRQIPLGNFASYELQEASADGERLILIGRLIGQAGSNADG